jgi:hypothetical protein
MQTATLSESTVAMLRLHVEGEQMPAREPNLAADRELFEAGIMEMVPALTRPGEAMALVVAPALTRHPADLSQGERCDRGPSTAERLDGPGRRVPTAGALLPLRRGAR